MNRSLRSDADAIIRASLKAVLPDSAVQRALRNYRPGSGRTLLISVGKAAWQMAKAALDTLGTVDDGLVITKYDHVKARFPVSAASRLVTRCRMKTALPQPGRPLRWFPA